MTCLLMLTHQHWQCSGLQVVLVKAATRGTLASMWGSAAMQVPADMDTVLSRSLQADHQEGAVKAEKQLTQPVACVCHRHDKRQTCCSPNTTQVSFLVWLQRRPSGRPTAVNKPRTTLHTVQAEPVMKQHPGSLQMLTFTRRMQCTQ